MVTFGQFGKHHLLVKTAVASFWATFGKVWGIFISTSGHTDGEPSLSDP